MFEHLSSFLCFTVQNKAALYNNTSLQVVDGGVLADGKVSDNIDLKGKTNNEIWKVSDNIRFKGRDTNNEIQKVCDNIRFKGWDNELESERWVII